MKTKPRSFKATLEKMQDTLGWTIVPVPFDPAKVWPEKIRQRIKGTINGFAFRTSLFPVTGKTGTYFLLVNRSMQVGGDASLGHVASFTLEPDLDPRPAELPEELDALLDEEPGLREYYESFTEYTRREMGKWILGVKSDEARMRRAQQGAERMLFAMEGERELPPAIAKALNARPKAKAGWAKMTELQRRNGLLAVGYYQTPESRAKRIQKLCDEAEKRAGK
ncbi:YdeI/OmpD-associated family protein [Terriglobus roseus]|uniref:Bacteriocin-protection, YdeI or OmpD-Associated n=1 Tax=Terriglobus roseus TaxID=392734 RepID=A0A1G7MVG9_9BACT|nr:YdeI/OmpD-associated family protein [Terriglobus roseus]SDF65818.1 Bacteriocin-protection, YdeI or OmpD-Associated [Terriglobus roseus]